MHALCSIVYCIILGFANLPQSVNVMNVWSFSSISVQQNNLMKAYSFTLSQFWYSIHLYNHKPFCVLHESSKTTINRHDKVTTSVLTTLHNLIPIWPAHTEKEFTGKWQFGPRPFWKIRNLREVSRSYYIKRSGYLLSYTH